MVLLGVACSEWLALCSRCSRDWAGENGFDRDEGRQDMWNVLKLDVCCPLGSTKRPSPGLMDRTEGRRLSLGDHRKSFPEHEESNRALSLLSCSF